MREGVSGGDMGVRERHDGAGRRKPPTDVGGDVPRNPRRARSGSRAEAEKGAELKTGAHAKMVADAKTEAMWEGGGSAIETGTAAVGVDRAGDAGVGRRGRQSGGRGRVDVEIRGEPRHARSCLVIRIPQLRQKRVSASTYWRVLLTSPELLLTSSELLLTSPAAAHLPWDCPSLLRLFTSPCGSTCWWSPPCGCC